MTVSRYTTLLFDFDHTLFDSDASEVDAFAATLGSFGVDEPSRHLDHYRRINHALWHEVERGVLRPDDVGLMRFEQLAASVGIDGDPHAMATRYLAALGASGDLYLGAREILEHLSERASLAMVTNAISVVQRTRIERLGLDSYFTAIVISSEVGISKPNPAIFDVAFDRLDRPEMKATVMIGDSLTSDIRGGANAGVDTCWYNPSGRAAGTEDRPTHEVAALDELRSLVEHDRTRVL